MQRTLIRHGFLLQAAVLLSLGSAGGCSIVGPEQAPESEGIVLLNRSDGPLVYLAIELESSHLVHPIARSPVEPDHDRLLARGDSVVLTAENVMGGYRAGDDVRFLLWAVRDGEAVLTALPTLTHEQLEWLGFRVEIRQL